MNLDVFNNREIAIFLWSLVLLGKLLPNKKIRSSMLKVLKCVFNTKIILYVATYLGYLLVITYSLYHFKLWDLSNLKDTAIWFMFSGLPIGCTVATAKNVEYAFWKNLILDSLKLAAIISFIVSSFTFSLIFELIFFPIVTFMVMLNAVAQIKAYEQAEKVTNSILAPFGLFILLYCLYWALINVYSIGSMSTVKSLMLPVIFSAISLPYMYIYKLCVEYEGLFLRLKLGKKRSQKLNLLVKLKLLTFCNIHLKKLQIARNMGNYNIMSISSKDDIDDMIRSYNKVLSSEKLHYHK